MSPCANFPEWLRQYQLQQVNPLEHFKPENAILMQYTGLKDKNGKEIWEGDVVRVKWGGIGDVVFEDGGFVSRGESGRVKYPVCESDVAARELEVIGNIYENPELVN
jgi:uncharacterized phage protein (TIGR01671 family)